jgi:ABC-type molybdenum transport system ATPase subunit/photorepair protein PhrA
MSAANRTRYRTTRDIVVPKGNNVIFVSHMRQDTYRLAHSIVRISPDMIYEWQMAFDDALASGLIEKVE